MTLRAYHGTVDGEVWQQSACLRATPQKSGHLRLVSEESFAPPLRLSCWVYPVADLRPGGTSGSPHMDGIHLHVGHQSNEANYLVSLVRRDGTGKVARQYDHLGYDDFVYGDVPVLKLWRRYQLTVDWYPDHITGSVESADGTATIEAELEAPRLVSGQVGLRLDNLVAILSEPIVTPL